MTKKILITGGAGFVGHHLVESVLKNTDWDIIVLDALTYAGNLNRLTDISCFDSNRVKFVYQDLRAPISKTTAKIIGGLDYIWHLASESDVGRSLVDSIPFAQSNVVGTANLLEYIKHYQLNLKQAVCFSTDEVFGAAPLGVYYKEDDRFKPSNPYSAAKAGEECMAYSFAHSFGLPIIITHCMNIFGERQHPEKFVPKTVKSILNGEKVNIHGEPKQISSRCWIHARNVADALFFLINKGQPEQSYNIVGEEENASWIANVISQVIKGRDLKESEIHYENFHETRPGHDFRYALSGEKLKKMGWEPEISLKQSLEKTVEWMIKPENKKWLNL